MDRDDIENANVWVGQGGPVVVYFDGKGDLLHEIDDPRTAIKELAGCLHLVHGSNAYTAE